MSGKHDPKTWRDARALLRSRGAYPARTKGSHQTWRLPDGRSFVVVCNHLGADMSVRLRAQLRRLLRLPASDDEPPRGFPWLADGRTAAGAYGFQGAQR